MSGQSMARTSGQRLSLRVSCVCFLSQAKYVVSVGFFFPILHNVLLKTGSLDNAIREFSLA